MACSPASQVEGLACTEGVVRGGWLMRAQVSEAELAGFFQDCGAIVDCRICGDPNSSMRYAFLEFHAEDSAQKASNAQLRTRVQHVRLDTDCLSHISGVSRASQVWPRPYAMCWAPP